MSDLSSLKRHVTQHSFSSAGDSLDFYAEERDVLTELLSHWDQTRIDEPLAEGESAAPQKWDNGTVSKLVLEHAALFRASAEDLGHALSVAGRHDIEHRTTGLVDAMRGPLRQMAKLSRGVNPMSLAGDTAWVEAFTTLRTVLQPVLLDPGLSAQAMQEAIGEQRQGLHSAKYIRKHAPTSPSTSGWVKKVPFLLRVQAAYDRSRGFPWAESGPQASTKIAKHYDREAS